MQSLRLRRLMVTDSCLIFLSPETLLWTSLSSFIICWLLTMGTHTRCGLQAANKFTKPRTRRKQSELSVSQHMFTFPLITSQYTLTNRLMQETGNKGTRHSLNWNKAGKVQLGPRISNSLQSHASCTSQQKQKCQTPKKAQHCKKPSFLLASAT